MNTTWHNNTSSAGTSVQGYLRVPCGFVESGVMQIQNVTTRVVDSGSISLGMVKDFAHHSGGSDG